MESQFHTQSLNPAAPSRCPFHDGPETLDGLLAELMRGSETALDLALDLRSAWVNQRDAAACVVIALRLRRVLNGAHYLAFYRVRQWLQRMIVVQVRGWRGAAWQTFDLPLNSARLDEIENACRAAWLLDHPEAATWVELAQVRFVLLSEAKPAQTVLVESPLTVTA